MITRNSVVIPAGIPVAAGTRETLDGRMTTERRGLKFPDEVPVLTDPSGRVTLRAHTEADLPAIVEQSNDPDSQHFTTVPMPAGGYGLDDARDFALGLVPAGWRNGTEFGWAIEADLGSAPRYCGTTGLGLAANENTAEVGFGLHPTARGHGVMSTALRLVRDYGFDVAGVAAIRWRARAGNWASRRVAAAAGFRFDGTIRKSVNLRGELVDAWVATITADDDRAPIRLPVTPELSGDGVRLRAFTDADADRIVEACNDPVTRQWLPRLANEYTADDARDFVESLRESAATRQGFGWCFTAPSDAASVGGSITASYSTAIGRAEIGYWTHPAARGRGLTSAAVRTVVEFLEGTGVRSALIRCASTNLASRRVAERAGFTLIGTQPASDVLADGTIDDLLLFHRLCEAQ